MSIRSLSLIATAALIGAATPALAQDSMLGEWRNTHNTVHLRVKPCGDALCGTVTWADDKTRANAKRGSGKEMVGSTLLHNLKRSSGGDWRGKVFLPDLNSSASATVVQVNNVLLRVSGCTFMGVVCKTQHWHRIG